MLMRPGLLAQAGHHVTIFESLPTLGMGAHGYTHKLSSGDLVIDVPFRVFSPRHYYNFSEMLSYLGMRWETVNYAATYVSLEGELLFRYNNQLIDHLSVPWLSPASLYAYWPVAKDAVRWWYHARSDYLAGKLANKTIAEYLDSRGFSDEFKHNVFYPIMSVIMTCDLATIRDYPAEIIVGAFTNGRGRGVKRAVGGTEEIVARLSARVAAIRCNTSIVNIEPGARPRVTYVSNPANGGVAVGQESSGVEEFDHVIVATEVMHVLRLFSKPPEGLVELVAQWGCETSEVVVHTDARLMPPNVRHWSPINVCVGAEHDRPSATMWLNALHPGLACEANCFQTWNPLVQPDEALVLTRTKFSRPTMGRCAADCTQRLEAMQGVNGIWFAGSYVKYGLPLLENGVESAIAVAKRLGAVVPWEDCPSVRGRHAARVSCLLTLATLMLVRYVLPRAY